MKSTVREPLVRDSDWSRMQEQVASDLRDFESRIEELRRQLGEAIAHRDRWYPERLESGPTGPGPEYWVG